MELVTSLYNMTTTLFNRCVVAIFIFSLYSPFDLFSQSQGTYKWIKTIDCEMEYNPSLNHIVFGISNFKLYILNPNFPDKGSINYIKIIDTSKNVSIIPIELKNVTELMLYPKKICIGDSSLFLTFSDKLVLQFAKIHDTFKIVNTIYTPFHYQGMNLIRDSLLYFYRYYPCEGSDKNFCNGIFVFHLQSKKFEIKEVFNNNKHAGISFFVNGNVAIQDSLSIECDPVNLEYILYSDDFQKIVTGNLPKPKKWKVISDSIIEYDNLKPDAKSKLYKMIAVVTKSSYLQYAFINKDRLIVIYHMGNLKKSLYWLALYQIDSSGIKQISNLKPLAVKDYNHNKMIDPEEGIAFSTSNTVIQDNNIFSVYSENLYFSRPFNFREMKKKELKIMAKPAPEKIFWDVYKIY